MPEVASSRVAQLPAAIEVLVARLAERECVERVVLFGSRARGSAQPRADVDLAVVAPSADTYEWSEIEDEVEDAETLLMIDLVRYHEADGGLKARIDLEGVTLFER